MDEFLDFEICKLDGCSA